MAQRVIEEKEYRELLKRIKYLEKLLELPSASLYARHVKGVLNSVAYVMPANEDSFTFIDGMDITVDQDSAQVMVDLVLGAYVSATPCTLTFAIEVDGVVDLMSSVRFLNTTTARRIYSAIMVLLVNPGRHRLRAMVSSTTAITVNFTEQSRWMRVAGIINNRRRYLNGKST